MRDRTDSLAMWSYLTCCNEIFSVKWNSNRASWKLFFCRCFIWVPRLIIKLMFSLVITQCRTFSDVLKKPSASIFRVTVSCWCTGNIGRNIYIVYKPKIIKQKTFFWISEIYKSCGDDNSVRCNCKCTSKYSPPIFLYELNTSRVLDIV